VYPEHIREIHWVMGQAHPCTVREEGARGLGGSCGCSLLRELPSVLAHPPVQTWMTMARLVFDNPR